VSAVADDGAPRAGGLGPMPGTDVAEAIKVVLGATPGLAAVPQLPARGVEAGALGRSLTLLDGLAADLQPAGWRLTDHPGVDARRARSLLARDLETLEDEAQGFDGVLKEQVVGPWTLAASVELPRGERVLADHGARRDLAESFAAGLGKHLAVVRRRVPGASLVVQVDEPSLPAVLGAQVRTASGYGRYRRVELAEADALLRPVVAAIEGAGAVAAARVPSDLPVRLLRGAGFGALATDLLAVRHEDEWAEALEGGTALWLGAVDPAAPQEQRAPRRALRELVARLGFAVPAVADRLGVTPTRGLEDVTPHAARTALRTVAAIAADRLEE